MSPSKVTERPARIAGCPGGFTDRSTAITRMAGDPDVDFVTMTVHGSGKAQLPLQGRMKTAMYAQAFLQCFKPSIPNLVKNKAKLAVNAGASGTELLVEVVVDLLEKNDASHLKVVWIEGDHVATQVNKLIKKGEKFESLIHGKRLKEWRMEPICTQAYLCGLCIVEAFGQGADIVLALLPNRFDELASSHIAGHLIECPSYAL
ncbi:hypothetical protein K469DRAFT_737126 [Zopfia rhizophila CBS 207.26]|uniref:Acyclic terpene utilisation N-terminal domain-containing protein n=1 Tax=Zopfia rhizophila CBS 207.26 TaxID=1314779 RepID=A0A6A6EBH7_9PEZI|nr:hypothetical protein K469DRAFT_737126 [Zopfia rhizophila CBS 207.26]